jgi:hypothetical protein
MREVVPRNNKVPPGTFPPWKLQFLFTMLDNARGAAG